MVGKPQSVEAAPYYFTYINQVETEDVLGALEGQLEESLALFATVSEEKSLYRYAPDKWSIRELLNHINDAERVFAFRAMWFARGHEAALPSFDQNVAASAGKPEQIRWAAHVEEFRRVRLSSVSLFSNLVPEAWMRSGVASDKVFTVRALAFIIVGHLTHHVRILRDRYL